MFDIEEILAAAASRREAEQREWEMLSPEEKEQREREQLLAEAKCHRSVQMSESMSIMAVNSFFRHQVEAERLEAIVMLSDKTGVPVSIMKQRGWVEHNVIASLIEEGSIELAREIALDPQKAREEHSELFKKADQWIKSQRSLPGFTEFK